MLMVFEYILVALPKKARKNFFCNKYCFFLIYAIMLLLLLKTYLWSYVDKTKKYN